MLIHPSSGACDLFVELFHGLYCSGSMCVGVTLWFGWGGVVSVCRLKHCVKCQASAVSECCNRNHFRRGVPTDNVADCLEVPSSWILLPYWEKWNKVKTE